MIIMGIDPGYAIVGYGVLRFENGRFDTLAYGAITTEAGVPIAERLLHIYNRLCVLLDRYTPDAVAVEEIFFNTNQTTEVNVSQARGVILLAAAQRNIAYFGYTPLQVKQAVVGYGRAEKKQVQYMTRVILGLPEVPKPDDTADALAIAVCHGHSAKNRHLRGR